MEKHPHSGYSLAQWKAILFQMFSFRLARRLFLVVFGAIVLIEAIIVIPSYSNARSSQLEIYKQQVSIAVSAVLKQRHDREAGSPEDLARIMLAYPQIVGIAAIGDDGEALSQIGEPIKLRPSPVAQHNEALIDANQRLEIYFPPGEFGSDRGIMVRVDVSKVWQALNAYLFRVLGLVLIICLVAGGIVYFYVGAQLIYPLEKIRDSLKHARDNPASADDYEISHSRNDEIGETIDLLNNALAVIAETHRSDVAYQEKRVLDFAAAGSDWFWEMDEKLRFSYFSDHFKVVTGVQPARLLGKTREETPIANMPAQQWETHLGQLHRHEPFRDFTHPRIKADGSTVWLSINGRPTFGKNGEFIGYRGSGSDITRLYEAQQALVNAKEAAEAGDRAKSEFLAITSHEIRTPMNAVIGMTDLLLDTELNEEQQQFAGIIQDSSAALMRIINDILDLSRLESRQISLEQAAFNYTDVISGVIEMLGAQTRGKDLSLTADFDDGLEGRFVGDFGRLRQVLVNLVGNALKFTVAGGISISVRQVGGDDSEPRIRTEIRDSGIGIPADAIDHLFDSFTQVDASTARRYGGTGLGLAICRKIIETMDGQIGVDSEIDAGSCFWFEISLPRAEPDDDADDTITIIGSQSIKTDHTGSQIRLLVVDDVPVNLIVARKMLTDLGYRVETAADGAEALAAVQEQRYDLVFMDIQMPGIDGLEATRQIRALDSAASSIPIIALTANSQEADRIACTAAGMSDFVAKPFVKKQLFKLLERFFPPADTASLKTG